ncbi:hypothetical protein [Paenibacillus agri]|uniref:Uncharacterized protein n=1 Tax=Paenibacillus agri TaxID=2744309 RepID=A0A850END4_9BACL|nr:hypothetical protein [Paenibacillus agri]NUU61280.1 hypothetical protein [Paenibacillus agri]
MSTDSLAAAKIRLMANACITRFDRGERPIEDVIHSYNMQVDNEQLVREQIVEKRPDISFTETLGTEQSGSGH